MSNLITAPVRRRLLQFPGITTRTDDFRRDVLEGLTATEQKTLPCKYLYDQRGSALFDQICELEEYYPTRTELAIMRENANAIASALGKHCFVIEFGSGSSLKIRLLLGALEAPAGHAPVDISAEHLQENAKRLADDFPSVEIIPVVADFTRAFEVPTPQEPFRPVAYFPGSTIGNQEPAEAQAFLRAIAQLVGPGGQLLLGYDRIKDAARLEPAYDDAKGVTAAFNLNLLSRINRELSSDIDVDGFEHVARWQPEHARMRLSLRSKHAQGFELGGVQINFDAGEDILTEYSHKYSPESMARLAQSAGFQVTHDWSDAEQLFSVALLQAR